MAFLTELHVHTCEVSPCADLTAEEVADRYIAAGYTSMVVTNHFISYILDRLGNTWDEKIDAFLAPVKVMRAYTEGKMNILLGAELRFDDHDNDYLLYGLTEEFLRAHPDFQKMSLDQFVSLARENGVLFVQAHPFRNGMRVIRTDRIDGIEVFNGHHGHDSRNDIANAWAEKYGLLRTSGSDFHHPHSVESGGILTDAPVTSTEQLVNILRNGGYTLHCSGPAAARDRMKNMLVESKQRN